MNLRSLNFGLDETLIALQDSVAAFVQKKLHQLPNKLIKTTNSLHLWKKFGDMGLLGMTVSEEYGGANMGYLAHIIAMQEISRASAAIGLSYGAHSNLCVNQINRNGNEQQNRNIYQN